MNDRTLGTLTSVKLRDIWSSEASDFTPWLAREENLSILGEVLGVELEIEAQERAVDPFRADILSATNCTQPTDSTTLLSVCPARILNFLLAVPNGFRLSFRDHAAERTHTPRAVMEAALAQTIRSKVEAAYARRIRSLSRSMRSLTTVSPPRPGLRTATKRPSAAGSSGSAQT